MFFTIRDPYRDIRFRHLKTVINVDYFGKLEEVYYRPFYLPPLGYREDIKLFYLALDKFTTILNSSENKFLIKMVDGNLFILHNRRVLHGRSAYEPTVGSRFLQGCYMDCDEIKGLHEKLHCHRNSSHNTHS